MGGDGRTEGKNPLLGAAVLKQLLRRRGGAEQGAGVAAPDAMGELYWGILRDLGVTDAQVEEFLARNGEAVEEAITAHARRGR